MQRGSRSTEWERKGNNHADHYAKLGAAMHSHSELAMQATGAMRSIHEQSIKWVVRSHISLQAAKVRAQKEDESKEKKRKKAGAFARTQQESWRAAKRRRLAEALRDNVAKGDAEASAYKEHHLRRATLDERGREHEEIIYCERCGAYAWKKTQQLHRLCRPALKGGLKDQRSRIMRGLCPWMSEKVRIHKHSVLAPPVAAMLVERLETLATEFDERQRPRARMREMLHAESTTGFEEQYGQREEILPQYGLQLADVSRIGDELAEARIGAAKRRKLLGKQPGTGSLA